jgi:hypothetical protein
LSDRPAEKNRAGPFAKRLQNVRNLNLGHKSLETTMIYLHLTTVSQERAVAAINQLME